MRRRRPKYLPFGTISHGTLKTEDIIEAAINSLAEVAPKRAKEMGEAVDKLREETKGDPYSNGAIEEFLHEELFQAMEAYLRPYFRFGSHEGDGSDIGVWLDHESLDEAIREGDVWDTRKGDHPRVSWAHKLVVSDHGNMTLYYRNGKQAWGIV